MKNTTVESKSATTEGASKDALLVLSWRQWFRRLDRPGWVAFLLVGALCYAVAFGVRLELLNQHYQATGEELPFTLESALQYRMTMNVFEGGGIPEHEPAVQYPEGIFPHQHYSLGAEYVYGAIMGLLPEAMHPSKSVRWAAILLFALGAPGVAWWVMGRFRSVSGGVVAGLFYAVAVVSVLRSFGLELSRENLGLPLFLLFLAADTWAGWWRKLPVARWRSLTLSVVSGVLAGSALVAWDLVQFPLGVWLVIRLARSMFSRKPVSGTGDPVLLMVWGVLGVLSVTNPYLRAHGFWHSPLFLLMTGGLLATAVTGWRSRRGGGGRPLWLRFLPLLVMCVGMFFAQSYGESYNHFGELLWAKIRYVNVKPMDPSLLTYEQRILWTPALHSATWASTTRMMGFPVILLFTCLGALPYVYRRRKGRPFDIVFCTVLTGLAYIFFVRFHVFLAFYGAALMGGIVAGSWRRSTVAPVVISLVLAVTAIVHEAVKVLGDQDEGPRWGRVNVHYTYTEGMLDWLKEHADGKPVLASFGVSGEVLTYAECPIVLHPKFETPGIRERVREYGEQLFLENEESLHRWALKHEARYLVYGKNQFSEKPEFARGLMRYMVNAMEPSEHASARVLEYRPDESRWFILEWENTKYKIFRIVSDDDKSLVGDLLSMSLNAMLRGDFRSARRQAMVAQRIIPRDPEVARLLNLIATQDDAARIKAERSELPSSD